MTIPRENYLKKDPHFQYKKYLKHIFARLHCILLNISLKKPPETPGAHYGARDGSRTRLPSLGSSCTTDVLLLHDLQLQWLRVNIFYYEMVFCQVQQKLTACTCRRARNLLR